MTKTRTLLLLGGSRQQVVAIETAKSCGYRTVLCDYLPDNPGQFHADVFYQISTTDRLKVLEVAEKEHVEGVVAYSSDPAAPTAAFVAEQLGLPSNPLGAVETMSVKSLFRKHMANSGIPCPNATAFDNDITLDEATELVSDLRFPIVVKPTDSSGSKGVSTVTNITELARAINCASNYGRNGVLIAEEYIERSFPHIVGGDIFVIDGEIRFWGLMSCLRDEACPLIPVGEKIPSGLSITQLEKAKAVLQKLVTSLGIKFGELNVEILFGGNDTPYVLELGARAGGNMIPVQLSDASGIDLVKANVMCAMGDNPGDLNWEPSNELFATYVLHSNRDGVFDGYSLSGIASQVCYRNVIYQNTGTMVYKFDGAGKALGILFFRFENHTVMNQILGHIEEHVEVKVI